MMTTPPYPPTSQTRISTHSRIITPLCPTTCPTAWHHLRPTMTPDCSDYLAYSHGLVYSLPPANYSRASMNFIDHTYIGVLPRSSHSTATHPLPRTNPLQLLSGHRRQYLHPISPRPIIPMPHFQPSCYIPTVRTTIHLLLQLLFH